MSLRAMGAMARNDVAIWLRSPAAMAAALLPALGMAVLVAVLTSSVGRQPVGLVVGENSAAAARMASILEGDSDAYLLQPMSPEAAERAIGDERIAAIIVVPSGFAASLARARAEVDLYLNNVDIDLADDVRRSVTRSVTEVDAPQLGLLGELHGPSEGVVLPNPYGVAIAEHDLRTTNVSFLQYQVIPILVLIVISIGLLGTALLTSGDFERGRAKLLMLGPVHRAWLVAGRILGGSAVTFVLVAPLIALGFLTRRIPYCAEESEAPAWLKVLFSAPCAWTLPVPSPGHAAALAALLVVLTVMTVGLGLLIGVTLRDARLVTMTALNAASCSFFLGGGFTTVAFLPAWIQRVSRLVPTSYAIEALRQALFYPDLLGFWRDLGVLSVAAVAFAALGAAALSRAWKRA